MAQMTLDDLVAQLRAAYADDLRSIVLYGSAAGGEHIPKRSDQNVLVIVRALGPERLRAAAAASRAWAETGNPAPLTFTESEWRGSADTFPMEYADILERNRILFGAAPFDGITVDPRDLRLQLEREAMGKLLHLRQGVLASGGEGKLLLELVGASLSTIMVLFRAIVRLNGEKPPPDNVELVQEVSRLAGFDAAPFERAVRHARKEAAIPAAAAHELISGYVSGVERFVAYLDAYGGNAGAGLS